MLFVIAEVVVVIIVVISLLSVIIVGIVQNGKTCTNSYVDFHWSWLVILAMAAAVLRRQFDVAESIAWIGGWPGCFARVYNFLRWHLCWLFNFFLLSILAVFC